MVLPSRWPCKAGMKVLPPVPNALPHAMAMDSALVALGRPEPPFRIQIVLGQSLTSPPTNSPTRNPAMTTAICSGSDPCWRPATLQATKTSFAAPQSPDINPRSPQSSESPWPGRRISCCSVTTACKPRSMQPASRVSWSSVDPLFSFPGSAGAILAPHSRGGHR